MVSVFLIVYIFFYCLYHERIPFRNIVWVLIQVSLFISWLDQYTARKAIQYVLIRIIFFHIHTDSVIEVSHKPVWLFNRVIPPPGFPIQMCEIHYRLRCPAVLFQIFECCMKTVSQPKSFTRPAASSSIFSSSCSDNSTDQSRLKNTFSFDSDLHEKTFLSPDVKMSIYAISLCINSLYHLCLRFIYLLMLCCPSAGEEILLRLFLRFTSCLPHTIMKENIFL